MKDKIKIEFQMEQKMCTNCKKTDSEYYELKLQLRYTFYDNIEQIKKETIDLINKNFNSINKLQELDNGFDIFFRHKDEINKISTLFQKKYVIEEIRTKKIVGRNFLESKDIFRHVQLINIINLKKEDTISLKGETYNIKAINNNDLVLREINTGAKKVITYSIVKNYLKKISK